MVSFKCVKGEKPFAFLHRLAPLLKIAALAIVFPAIFFPMLFIAVGALLLVSVAINYFKWYLLFNINYVIKDGALTVKKSYKFIKDKYFFISKLTEIENCDIIEEMDIVDIPNSVECLCEQTTFKVFICIKIKNNPNNYILVADNYFYSLIKEKK